VRQRCERNRDLRDLQPAAPAARQNDIKKLGSWAAILAAPTAIAGIYGMNFKNVPELGVVFRLPRELVVDARDLQYSLLLLSKGRLALAFRSARA
jgi:CorA-like Mg2+ transporter protein